MTPLQAIAAVVALGLLIYLAVALARPESLE